MNRIINLTGDIDNEMFENFVQEVNHSEETPTIFLNSLGGDPTIVPAFRKIIEYHKIPIVAFGRIYSAALDLVLFTNTKREVLDDSTVMLHRAVVYGTDVTSSGQTVVDKKLVKIWKEFTYNEYSLIKSFFDLTDRDINKIKKGEEYYFSSEELRKAIKNSEKYFEETK